MQNGQELADLDITSQSFEKLRKVYSDSLFNTGAKEETTREKLWLAYNIVGKVEQHLLEILDTGKLASKQLEDFRTNIRNKKF